MKKEAQDRQSDFDWTKVWAFARLLMRHYRLYFVLVAFFAVLFVIRYLVVLPTFTAEAIVGPPGPSPTGMLLGSDGSITSGIDRSILSAGASGGKDPYQDFLQLLPSSRLSEVLIERDHILQTLFASSWNPVARRWKSRGPVHMIVDALKKQLNIPVVDQPNVDMVTKFLAGHLTVTPSKSASSSPLLGGSSQYMVVTFWYSDRREAERLLSLILSETDRIVREEQKRDVSARIAFLQQGLSRQDISTYERNSLISILSDQEQVHTMLEADQRYASTLIVPPYASTTPTSPPGITKTARYVVLFSALFWVALVYLSDRFELARRLLSWSIRTQRFPGATAADPSQSMPWEPEPLSPLIRLHNDPQ